MARNDPDCQVFELDPFEVTTDGPSPWEATRGTEWSVADFNRFSSDTTTLGIGSIPGGTSGSGAGDSDTISEGDEGSINKKLQDCYDAAFKAHHSDSSKLTEIGSERIEGFFGSLANQRSAARWDLAIGVTTVVRDTALATGGAYFIGLGASASYARAAASTRRLYSTARNALEVNALARVAAQYQLTANYVQVGTSSAYLLSYHAIQGGNATDILFNIGGEMADFGLQSRFGQAGLTLGLSKAALDYIDKSGLSDAQAAEIVTDIARSLSRTQESLNSQLSAALSACDEKYK